MSTFSIPNKPFSEIFNLTIYDLLQADPNALQIMVMAYRGFFISAGAFCTLAIYNGSSCTYYKGMLL